MLMLVLFDEGVLYPDSIAKYAAVSSTRQCNTSNILSLAE
jgi:hypothetical protein